MIVPRISVTLLSIRDVCLYDLWAVLIIFPVEIVELNEIFTVPAGLSH